MQDFNRRKFLQKSLLIGTGLILLPKLSKGNLLNIENIDISVVTGNNYFENTVKAIEQLGGISRFASRGTKAGLLVNFTGQWTRPSTYVNPEIVLAVLKMLNDAGVKEITYLVPPMAGYFKKNKKSAQYESIINTVKSNSGEFKEIEIPKGVSLNKALIIKDLFDCDVFINISINKHHSGTLFTNSLKNYMGATKRETNLFFHNGPEKKEGQEDMTFLSQCIADINLVRKPDLCISDATEILKTNGPFGPGEVIKPGKVYASSDPVAMDSYGCTFLDYRPEDIYTTVMANKHGIGRIDLKNLNIKETSLIN